MRIFVVVGDVQPFPLYIKAELSWIPEPEGCEETMELAEIVRLVVGNDHGWAPNQLRTLMELQGSEEGRRALDAWRDGDEGAHEALVRDLEQGQDNWLLAKAAQTLAWGLPALDEPEEGR